MISNKRIAVLSIAFAIIIFAYVVIIDAILGL